MGTKLDQTQTLMTPEAVIDPGRSDRDGKWVHMLCDGPIAAEWKPTPLRVTSTINPVP